MRTFNKHLLIVISAFVTEPFAASLPHSIPAEASVDQRRLLEGETWFHGTVSRNEAEDLLKHVSYP